MRTKSKNMPVFYLSLGGLFCAFFFLASNILPPIAIIPGVPITFQVLVVAAMAGVLGFKFGLTVLGTIFLMTAVGIPMMSGFSGGPATFIKPTAGYIVGWLFIVLTVGIWQNKMEPRLVGRRHRKLLSAAGFMASGILGLVLCYVCGAAWLSLYNGIGLSGFWVSFLSNGIFFPADALKLAIAWLLCRAIEGVLRRLGKPVRQDYAKN